MSTRKLAALIAATICLTGVGWLGCSDNPGSADYVAGSGITSYFPLEEGYGTVYEVTYSNGTSEFIRYKAGREVPFQGATAVEYFYYGDDGEYDTDYFRATSNALYYYSTPTATAEKILEMPFTLGRIWSRYSEDDDLQTNTDTTNRGYDKFDQDTTDTDGESSGPLLSYPVTASTYMSVAGTESIQLKSGSYYTRTLKIMGDSQSGKNNYYWYAAGIGLVKYVIGASGTNDQEGDVVGELVSYGY